ncbi:hypothetical protein HF521_022623 [Silurus meridionalis]|uniref:Sushi domain-containing protein n=1 Tax=Silurus meridionalis TaxID=175797 RepID=A0A8T0BE90_SILME|nr:hypothetical protein HF521_022623 [Silurus meridionalis]
MGSNKQKVVKIFFAAFFFSSFTLVKSQVEKSVCAEALQNGFILKSSRGFFYSCDSDYKPFNEKWWEEVTCLDGQWSNATLCIPNHQCGQVPTDHQTNNQTIKGYENESVEEFQCESGPCCFKCVNGNWEKRNCEFQGCPNPPYVENAVITSHSQQTVTYECRDNYSINGEKTISCIDSEWEKTPTCTLGGNNRCSDPERDNGITHSANHWSETLDASSLREK